MIEVTDNEKKAIDEAKEAGQKIYGMTVYIQKECLLKAARAFLVFRAVEEFGQILVYRPSSQDIEDEKFELDFSFLVASNEDLEKIQSAASNVSEIEKVVGKEVSEFHLEGEETAVQEKEQTAAAPAKEEEKKPASEPKTSYLGRQCNGRGRCKSFRTV